jgi:hypothetical protein
MVAQVVQVAAVAVVVEVMITLQLLEADKVVQVAQGALFYTTKI